MFAAVYTAANYGCYLRNTSILPLVAAVFVRIFQTEKRRVRMEKEKNVNKNVIPDFAVRRVGVMNAVGGFTLIELLVVVLIIGILAAVALPQYQKAVLRSRATQAFVTVKHLKDLEELYFLENGQYTENFEELGAEYPSTAFDESNETLTLNNYEFTLLHNFNRIIASHYQKPYHALSIPLVHNPVSYQNARPACLAYSTDQYAGASLCKTLTGSNAIGTAGCGGTCQSWYFQNF